MKKIVILDAYSVNPGDLSWDAFSNLGEPALYDNTSPADTVARIGDAEIILTNKVVIDEQVIAACKNLKYVGVLATGYNVVDLQAAARAGIVVTNIPAYSTQSVVQHVFALLLDYCSKVAYHSAEVKKGRWENNSLFCFWDYPLIEIWGKTLGILGLGKIGEGVAKAANAFGMKVIASSRTPKEIEGVEFVSREELFRRSDFITLHCPLTEETKGIVNKESIGAMKDGVVIINTGRGPLVNEGDMVQALDSGKAAAYLADVFATEPPAKNNPLIRHERSIITPHYAWAPREARMRLMDIAYKNIEAFQKGSPINKVN